MSKGIYLENLVIRTPRIQIEPENASHDVFLIGQNGPTVLIDIKDMHGCNIQNLRIGNRGFNKHKFREDFINMIDIMGMDRKKTKTVDNTLPRKSKKKSLMTAIKNLQAE